MNLCENCRSLDTCAVAMPNTEKCFFFAPTEDFRIKNSKEYAIGYEQGKADERATIIDDCIESIIEVKKWYEEEFKEIYDVQIRIVLDDLNALIDELKEKSNETM